MLHIVGNGPSRLKYDLDHLENWWGCNAISHDYTPDLLFSVDIVWHEEVISNDYYKNNKVAVGSWDPIDISMWSPLLESMKMSGENIRTRRKDDDTHFIIQGTGMFTSFLGYNAQYQDNIIQYDYPELKNLFSGMSALGYACVQGHKEITMIGYDVLQHRNPGNVYAGKHGSYLDKYTEEARVFTAQGSQFIALLKHFSDVNVYFKNDLDKLERVQYDELSYYDECDEWVLGEGFELKI